MLSCYYYFLLLKIFFILLLLLLHFPSNIIYIYIIIHNNDDLLLLLSSSSSSLIVDDDGGNEKWGMTPTIVVAKLLHRLNKLPDGSCGRPAMGNDHSRKPLLPIFKHLEEVSIEELQAVYTRYRYKSKSPPFLTRQQYSAIFFDEDKPKPAIDPNETEHEANIRRERENSAGFDEKTEDRSHR